MRGARHRDKLTPDISAHRGGGLIQGKISSRSTGHAGPTGSPGLFSTTALRVLLLVAAAVFLALHYVHLTADFPNGSPWVDRSKFTDEGWYGGAAVRYLLEGHWYVLGDFNTAAALPVLPLLEVIPFAVFGVSIVVARAFSVTVFALSCGLCWLLLYRWRNRVPGVPRDLAPELAVLLLTVSPFAYSFGRLAILEPPLVLWSLLGLLLAGEAGRAPSRGRFLQQNWPVLSLGLLLPVMLLTKSTAAAIMPAFATMLWFRAESASSFSGTTRGKLFWCWIRLAACPVVLILSAYLVWIAHSHLSLDIRHYFLMQQDRINRLNIIRTTFGVFWDLRWLGVAFGPLGAAAALLSLRGVKRRPLELSLLVWIAGYLAFIWFHARLEPRYYLVVLFPLLLLLARVLAATLAGVTRSATPRHRGFAAAIVLLFLAAIALEAGQTLGYVRHPQYTLIDTARGIRAIELADPQRSTLLLSLSGGQMELMNGLPAICGSFQGTMTTLQMAQRYKPGWVAARGGGTDSFYTDPLLKSFRLEEAGRFLMMDDPEKYPLVLYKLDPIESHPADPTKLVQSR